MNNKPSPSRINDLPIGKQGYIKLTLIFLVLIFVFFLYPHRFPGGSSTSECMVGDPPPKEEQTVILPEIKDLTAKLGEGRGGPGSAQVEYVLIRKNVPVIDGIFFLAENDSPPNEHAYKVNDPNMPDHVLYYPGWWTHFLFHRNVRQSNETGERGVNNNLANRAEGLIVAVQKDADGEEKKEILPSGHEVRIADYYQIRQIYDGERDYETEELFYCSPELRDETKTAVVLPSQSPSTAHDQLQLEWFLFKKGGGGAVFPHCKPAVYLYPQRREMINVRVYPKGELSYSDPKYDQETGWFVEAAPDGKLFNLARNSLPITHNYLYYESKIRDEEIKKPTSGWVVKKTELGGLFNEILPKLGLNAKEKNDFEKYWLTKLPKSPYYFVGIIDKTQRDYLEPLAVVPQPDTQIRFSLYFEMLTEPKNVKQPEIITPKRVGFTLVDWGGMIKLHPNTPFTCSQ